MRDNEIFAAGLADQSRIGAVSGDIFADRLPHGMDG
jgi:hypothetical protein